VPALMVVALQQDVGFSDIAAKTCTVRPEHLHQYKSSNYVASSIFWQNVFLVHPRSFIRVLADIHFWTISAHVIPPHHGLCLALV
jgi:hypothetical protein